MRFISRLIAYGLLPAVFLLVLPGSGLNAQTKYLIYLKDKGFKDSGVLNKAAPEYQEALILLSPASIERRKKVMNEDQVISYEDLPLHNQYLSALESGGIKIENKLRWINAVSAYLDQSRLDFVRSLTFVSKVERVASFRYRRTIPDGMNNEGIYKQQLQDSAFYGVSYSQLALSDVPAAHKKGITGVGVRIGLLDSGFRWDISDAMKHVNVLGAYDFIFHDSTTYDQNEDAPGQQSHGSRVFSIIAGYLPGKFVGPAFSSDYLLAKTEDIRSETHLEEDNYGAALEWMESAGVDITSSSLGYSDLDEDPYTYSEMNGRTALVTVYANKAFEKGVLTITSAGNEGNLSWRYITAPADAINIISVGAVDSRNNVAAFSSRGPSSDGRIKPEVTARGVGVYFADAMYQSSFSSGNGTSYSAPIVSGVAGLLLSAFPHLTNVQMRNILISTAGNANSPDNERGYGLVSAKRAIEYPNVENLDNSYRLHKAFLNAPGIRPESVQLYISSDNRNFSPQTMNSSNSVFYTYTFTGMPAGESIYFYFDYTDSLGQSLRYPERSALIMTAGNPLIREIITPENASYQLSQNHPNPFNLSTGTNIHYIAEAGERAELYIIDAIGQKVKVFDLISVAGDNTVFWNGRNDKNENCASGIYYYILRKGGKEYGNKMVLLK